MAFRLRAFLWHFLASLLMASLALMLVYGVWYPSPLHALLGVTSIFLIVLAVDVVIGPVLTFVVAKQGKKSLKFDLATIICVQLAAFFYGLYTVAEGRPIWLVFTGDRFEVALAYELQTDHRERAAPPFSGLSWFGPRWVGASLPDSAELRNELIFSSVAGGADLAQRPDFYQLYETKVSQIRESAMPLADLAQTNEQSAIDDVLRRWSDADAYLPLINRKGELTVLLKRDTAEVVAIVELVPW